MLAKGLGYLGLLDQVDGNLDEADRKIEESLRLATVGGFKDSIAQNHTWLGAHANWRGDFRKALVLCGQAEQVSAEIHDGFQELFAIAFGCLAHIGLGEYREALAVINDGLAKARDRNNLYMVARLSNTLGWLHQELGDFKRSVEFDREHGFGIGEVDVRHALLRPDRVLRHREWEPRSAERTEEDRLEIARDRPSGPGLWPLDVRDL